MSWFGTDPAAELDAKIEEATSESIPNGEMDMAVALEITDLIRSKSVPPKQAMRGLKKRMTKVYANPNTLAAVLKLADVCVKNGGSHFLVEINSKEFIDYMVEYIFKVHYDVKNYKVYSSEAKYAIGTQILRLVKEWSMYFQDKPQGNYLGRVYGNLTNQGYEFPAVDAALSGNPSNFIDTKTPPDWIDGPECMICYTAFSVMTRKHHCRACGGVFCHVHSANSIPLPHLGILEPVRVCDDCFQIHNTADRHGDRQTEPAQKSVSASGQKSISTGTDEDEQLRKAIELSLQDSGVPVAYERPSSPPPGHVESSNADDDDMDEEMKAAIAASLAEFQQAQGKRTGPEPVVAAPTQHAPQEPFSTPAETAEAESDFYSNIMPFNANAYSQRPADTRQNGAFSSPPPLQQPNSLQPQFTQQQEQPPQLPPVEDLAPQEEEDITLFVQLMNGIKNDPAKQANILYDQNLGELHGRVVRLKPKLNRALRSSIEKYELFLEMNNKINSITRLYDQFLDHKLNQAYNKHTISSPGASYNLPQQTNASGYNQQFFVDRNNPHEAFPHQTGPQVTSQSTAGYQEIPYQPTAPQRLAPQPTAPGEPATSAHSQIPLHSPRQSSESSQIPSTVPYQHTGVDPLGYQPTAPALGEYPATSSRGTEHQSTSVQNAAYSTSKSYSDADTRQNGYQGSAVGQSAHKEDSRSSIPYPASPEVDQSATYENVQVHRPTGELQRHNYKSSNIPSYPQVPSSPPSDGFSDTESVASRYPALEEKYGESTEDLPNDGPREHASTRFPSLNELDLPELSHQSLPELKKSTTSESKKFKAEPEPLIEL